ncbi:hypothetical protein GGI07_002098 [Coemansia sp. Benny D115]|nr:hypothetical protein GGI07_002098 [Coemansia sp. Benny D115]
MSKLEGRTPGNHFDFVTTLPQTTAVGGTANINVVSGGRNRSDSVQSAGFGGSHGRSIGFDTANLQTFLPNMRSNISDATKAGVEITSVEGSVDHQRSDNDDEIVAHMA